jgi:hypothetical protein
MLPGDFTLRSSFKTLDDLIIQEAILAVEGTWSGVATLWSTVNKKVAEAKRRLCYNYLVAWYIADMYPDLVKGTYQSGGALIRSKEIGGVYLTFKDRKVQPELETLTSNTFGQKALDMLLTCPDMYLIR